MLPKLKKDAIGILPTDTLYGIVGSAFSKSAVERIYEVKKRNLKKPLIILISGLDDLKKFGVALTKPQKTYLEKVWPGKVSVVLSSHTKKFEYLHRGTHSLAFRFPKKKSLQVILEKVGPLVAPSANPESLPPAETIAQAKKYFGNSVDFYISGGTKKGSPSRLITLDQEGKEKILRK